jgi:hypothetical protein
MRSRSLQYWPAFEVIIHTLPQENVQELDRVLNAFVLGLQKHDSIEPWDLRCRSDRALSCPPAGSRTTPFSLSAVERASSQRNSACLQLQRIYPGKDRFLEGDQRERVGQGKCSDKLQDMQITSHDAPTNLLDQQVGNISLNDRDDDIQVLEDADSSESVDFLATLRHLNPQLVSELERQYESDIAESRHEEKSDADFGDIDSG